MNRTSLFSLALAALAAFAALFLWGEVRALRAELASVQEELPEGEAVELGEVMLAFQIRYEKLHAAGKAGNRRLAQFYLEELEEQAADLYGEAVMEEQINVSDLMESLMPPEIERMSEAVASEDQARFDAAFHRLTAVCNACHQSTGHGFVVVGEPTAPLLSSQRYGEEPSAAAGLPRVTSVQ